MLYKGAQKLIGETLTIEKIKAALYPVGSVIVSESERDLDLEIIGSHWELENEGVFIQATRITSDVGTIDNEELPNIKGSWGGAAARSMRDIKGAFTGTTVIAHAVSWGGSGNDDHITLTPFDASNGQVNADGSTYVQQSESVYKNGGKVKPVSRKYYIYRRIS